MEMNRRNRYVGQGRTISHTDKTVDINFDLATLDMMCAFALTENRTIRRGSFVNLRNLIDRLNLDLYLNDPDKLERIKFIKKALEARLERRLTSIQMILSFVSGGFIDNTPFAPNNFPVLNGSEVEWVNSAVTMALNYTFVYNNVDRMIDLGTRFKAADYASKDQICTEIEEFCNMMHDHFRRTKNKSSIADLTFSLKDGTFEDSISEIHDRLTNPSRILRTGMQGFNELIGGGFYSSRVYMLYGLTGIGKSLALLNIAYQIKKYNKQYVPKDPTKIPCVLILTMENEVSETVERLWNISTTPEELKNFSKEEIMRRLKEDGELYLSDDNPIDILIKFAPDKSIDTGDLYTIVEDLEDEGYEVICLVQDHIKKIRSATKTADLRLELGEVVNEFKTFSTLKDIPVISNSHLNREGMRTVDQAIIGGKSDLVRMLGRANIGESAVMLDNVDASVLIHVEYDSDGIKYLSCNRVKCRYPVSQRNIMFFPFATGNNAKLIEDLYSPIPLFKETLRPAAPTSNGNQLQNNVRNTLVKPSSYCDIGKLDNEDSEDSIFFNNSTYSSADAIYSSSAYNNNKYDDIIESIDKNDYGQYVEERVVVPAFVKC